MAVNGRDAVRTEEAVERLRSRVPGGELFSAPGDLATDEGLAEVLDRLPQTDILVNSLGIFGARPALEIDDAEWRRYFEVNVLTAVRLIRAYLPSMKERGWGRVLNIASDSAVVIPAEMIQYGMSKTALLAVSRGFAKEAAGTGVTVNSVISRPHPHRRRGGVRLRPGRQGPPLGRGAARLHARVPPAVLIQRLIEPEEIAHLVVYLSSPLASATTGGALRVDGGYVDSILP